MAWRGASDDTSIWFSILNPQTSEWTGQVKIKGIGTSSRLSLEVLNNEIFMTWVGIKSSYIYSTKLWKSNEGGNYGIYFLWPR